MRKLLVAGTVLVVALMTATGSAFAQSLPSGFWGVVPQGELTRAQFERLAAGGVESVRIPFDWGVIQATRGGAYEWVGLDQEVAAATEAGIRVLPFLDGAPTWTVPAGNVPGTGGAAKAPAHLPVSGSARAAWSAFVAAAVKRYGPGGEFWSSDLGLPARPIRTWQIWNEPNFAYFVTHPNPAEYGRLVETSDRAIKATDPSATIVLAGLFARPKGARNRRTGKHKSANWYASDFIAAMLRRDRPVRRYFDAVALHPYAISYTELPEEIEETRSVLSAAGLSSDPLYVTELGWSSEPSDPAVDQFAKGVAGQARELTGALGLLRTEQAAWRLRGVFWFSAQDGGGCNFCGGSGLFTNGFVPKPSWRAFVRLTEGRP